MKLIVKLEDNERIGADIGGHVKVKDIAPSELVGRLLQDIAKRVTEIYSCADTIDNSEEKDEEDPE